VKFIYPFGEECLALNHVYFKSFNSISIILVLYVYDMMVANKVRKYQHGKGSIG